jgi:hypothetical protein
MNRIYRHIYLGDIFENYLQARGLRLKESYMPYWEMVGR